MVSLFGRGFDSRQLHNPTIYKAANPQWVGGFNYARVPKILNFLGTLWGRKTPISVLLSATGFVSDDVFLKNLEIKNC